MKTGLPHKIMQSRLWLAVRASGAVAMFTLAGALPKQVQAWGADGHRLVAIVAETQLSASTRVEVNRLLALEPGATLASVSTWADEVRSPSTAAWHYLNFPRDAGCHYDADRMCIEGNCVVGAIERQIGILASKAPDLERLKALKYIVHFVADVHQPLHAGYGDDRGGNRFQLRVDGRGTNLHALWDSGMIMQWTGGLPALRAAVVAEPVASPASSPVQWAEESCGIVVSEGFYPAGPKLDSEYAQRWSATLAQRLAAAARALATFLNDALARQ